LLWFQVISKISDDRLHQIDVYKKRSSESSAFLNGSGNAAGLYATKDGDDVLTESFGADARLDVLTNEGGSCYAEILWKPPLGLFDYDRALPPSKYEVQLKTRASNPLLHCLDFENFKFNESKEFAIQKTGGSWNNKTAADIVAELTSYKGDKQSCLDWSIESVYMYAAIVQGPRADDVKYALDLTETTCVTQQLTQATGNVTTNFDVGPNTRTIAWALQGNTPYLHGSHGEFRVGTRPLQIPPSAAAKAQGLDVAVKTKPRLVENMPPIGIGARNIGSWFVSYDGKQYPPEHSEQEVTGALGLPEPNAGPADLTDKESKSFLMHRFLDTLTQTGTHFTSSGGETCKEWAACGPYYYMTWPRQGTANATRLMLTLNLVDGWSDFTPEQKKMFGFDANDAAHRGESSLLASSVLLFYTQAQCFLIRTKDSRVVQVETPLNTNSAFNSVFI